MTDDLKNVACSKPPRALLIGPGFATSEIGGLPIALNEVADQLRARGWQIDAAIYATPAGKVQVQVRGSLGNLRTIFLHSSLTPFQRWHLPRRLWDIVPRQTRRFISMLFMPRRFFEHASNNLSAIEEMLAEPQRYDAVLCTDGGAPGMTGLISERHKRVVIISIVEELASELRANWWPWMRLLAHFRLRGHMHPFLFRQIAPCQIRLAVFASSQWREVAIQAGVPEETTHTIYFGVPLPQPLPRPIQVRGRLLWVGRLGPEKGLHVLLQALPSIREKIQGVSLTAIAAQGGGGYRQGILEMVRRYELQNAVTFRTPVDRAALQKAYAEHDVLFFHSIFYEPVALVLMEAFAAGLPVVASKARAEAKLVEDNVTCLCYQRNDPVSVVTAIVRMLTDTQLRDRLALNAQQLVRQEFSLDKMGQAYDRLLRQFALDNSLSTKDSKVEPNH